MFNKAGYAEQMIIVTLMIQWRSFPWSPMQWLGYRGQGTGDRDNRGQGTLRGVQNPKFKLKEGFLN
jgi:hypothetical protein